MYITSHQHKRFTSLFIHGHFSTKGAVGLEMKQTYAVLKEVRETDPAAELEVTSEVTEGAGLHILYYTP